MTTHVVPSHRPGHADRGARRLALCLNDRLHLLLALCCALTGTPWGVAMSLVVLLVLVARRAARREVERSVATRRRVLAATQQAGPLHAARGPRQAAARP